MAVPAERLVPLFKQKSGQDLLLDLGGSETLLPKILAGAPADVFLCHDPFEQEVKAKGHWAGSVTVGQLRPVLIVRPGNPRGVHSINDLTNRQIKLGIGDPRYSTCGQAFVELLEKKHLRDAVLPQVKLRGRTHAEIANGLILGPLDAAVVWNYIARLYSNKVEVVSAKDEYPPIRVTVVGLKDSAQPGVRDAFLHFCRSSEVQRLFAEQGYGIEKPPLP